MERKTIGRFIASLRKANGYTQSDLAEILGVSNKTISSWETDNSSPDLSILPAIADLFRVSIDELIRGEKNKEAQDNIVELSQKSEKIRNNMIKSLKSKYANMSYISIGLFVGALAFIIPGVIINHIICFVLLIIGILIYIFGIVFSIITFNDAKNKINDEEDNSIYLRFIHKKKLLIQCLYSFFLLSPLFCFITNNMFKSNDEFKATEKDLTNLNHNFSLKKKLCLILGVICVIVITGNIVLNYIPFAYFNERYDFKNQIELLYTLEIENHNGKSVSIISQGQRNSFTHGIVTSEDENNLIYLPEGTYKFDIYCGSYDELKTAEDFSQYGFDIKYVEDYRFCQIYYEDELIFTYDLFVTNKNTAYYNVNSTELYEYSNGEAAYNYDNGTRDSIKGILTAFVFISSGALIVVYFAKRKEIL